MKSLDAHRKLLSLLCLALLSSMGLVSLAGCGGALSPEQQAPSASAFESYDQLVERFDQIVPGMTQAQDLPNLGFDASKGRVELLSHVRIEQRFRPAAGTRQDPAVSACIQAQVYCTGYVFHPSHEASRRMAALVTGLPGFQRITRSGHWAADVTLLVMNGRVVHKLFSANPRNQTISS